MIIKSVKGVQIYSSQGRTLRQVLAEAIDAGIVLKEADFRGARLRSADLDGINAPGACFWGCDLTDADLSGANLKGADFRHASLTNVCLGESDLSGADFRAAYMPGVILRAATLNGAVFSCPSFWSLDLNEASSADNVTYWHRGETSIHVEKKKIIRIFGLEKPLVLTPSGYVWGYEFYAAGRKSAADGKVRRLIANIQKLARDLSQNENMPMQKID